jgi:hypothetical protein
MKNGPTSSSATALIRRATLIDDCAGVWSGSDLMLGTMKTARVIFLVLGAFILGYAARTGVDEVRLERRRASLEEYYRSAFPVGAAFEKVAAPMRERGLDLRFVPDRQRYDAVMPPDLSARLQLYVEVDEKQRVKSVRVAQVFLL